MAFARMLLYLTTVVYLGGLFTSCGRSGFYAVLDETNETDVEPNVDECPQDEMKIHPGTCGCGMPDDDSDGDGSPDCIEMNSDQDSDGDGDGWLDSVEIACGSDPLFFVSTPIDDDDDGVCNSLDSCPVGDDVVDVDSNGNPDACDLPWHGVRGSKRCEDNTRKCPEGYVAVGIDQRKGDWVDLFWLICREKIGNSLSGQDAIQIHTCGNEQGGSSLDAIRCDTFNADGVLIGQQIWYSYYGVKYVGGKCARLSDPATTWLIGQSSEGVMASDTSPAGTYVWSIDILSEPLDGWAYQGRLVCRAF